MILQYFDYNEDEKTSSPHNTILNNLTDDEWSMLVRYCNNIEFQEGKLLLKAGEVDNSLYIVISGSVEVLGNNPFGFEKKLAVISAGSVFGELSFFDSQPRSASIRSLTQGQVLRISHNSFDRIAAWNPKLAQQLLFDLGRVIALRFREN